MQNRVKLPGGLLTGSGPKYNSKGTLVTCLDVFCDDEPSHVMEHITWEGKVERWGAYCEPYLLKRIAPAAEVEAAMREGVRRQGESFDTTRLPLSDKYWRYREYTADEQAAIDKIRNGELVETYVSPGVFEWQPPASSDQQDPCFDWFEELTEERKLERQVLLLAAGHPEGLEPKRLGELLDRTHRDKWAPVYDVTWALKRRGLLTISPKSDDPEIQPCSYRLTAAGEVLADEVHAQARAYGEYWRKRVPDLPEVQEVDNTGGQGTRAVAWYFHNPVNASRSGWFATWRRGESFARLWSAEGALRDVLAWSPEQPATPRSVESLAAAWGPVATRIEWAE
ncbi:hypothetical protein [Streptomyces mobaraensis]|uniref:Uncharacterized protein n=1 Tax=Streptomyces mobaraensis TaxID=35621 RepID=A0A5N5W2X8_STRMB|nr:hypothetical protein [Streptomyces mobaraensis]KAB7835716.1 hypothetical protein FRZ00_26195 [Streptomyces mobaraensis]